MIILKTLEKKLQKHKTEIESWLAQEQKKVIIPFYTSVDIRNSGFKISAIDTNLFPAGFNNLCPGYTRKASELVKKYMANHFPDVKNILIIPESHTRNQYYLSNVKKLQSIITQAGFEVCLGTMSEEMEGDILELTTAENEPIILKKIQRKKKKLIACVDEKGIKIHYDLIIINNDLSDGIPDILKDIEQSIIPSPLLGWAYRKKSDNLGYFEKLIKKFAKIIDMDPWFFTPMTETMDNVDFMNEKNIHSIAKKAEILLNEITAQYKKYEIDEKPYIFIKNNSGTYGMGVEKFENVEEILRMNRKIKNKLQSGKGGNKVRSILIQEGIPTIDRYQNFVAEPVIYLIGGEPTGGFFRLNEEKSERDNLNARGMKFNCLCFHKINEYHNKFDTDCDLNCLAMLYLVIAQIATLAAGYEQNAVQSFSNHHVLKN
ncbi:glutamate--cysteine ligase [Candidatus Peregrinibacteria bacterium]|nr:glutamate--cysteine ligase [Candidatus Peregrinibacteria bacterium]